MKKYVSLVFIIAFLFSSVNLIAQEDKSKRVSPPKVYTKTLKDNTISINYSVLSARDRKIWGELVPYDKIWRTGANEATIFEVTKDCKLNGNKLAAGKYSLFTIPREDGKWTVILNKVPHQWGAYEYDQSKDALRFVAMATTSDKHEEKLVFEISNNGLFTMKWAYLQLNFEIE